MATLVMMVPSCARAVVGKPFMAFVCAVAARERSERTLPFKEGGQPAGCRGRCADGCSAQRTEDLRSCGLREKSIPTGSGPDGGDKSPPYGKDRFLVVKPAAVGAEAVQVGQHVGHAPADG